MRANETKLLVNDVASQCPKEDELAKKTYMFPEFIVFGSLSQLTQELNAGPLDAVGAGSLEKG